MKNIYSKTAGFVMLMLYFLCLGEARGQSSLNRAGLKAGPVLSSFWGDDIEENDLRFRPGYVAGITMSFEIASWFALQPELLYTSKGAVMYPENNRDYRVNYSLDYLEIPLLFKFVTPSTGLLKGHLYFGPYGAALVQNNVSVSYNDVELRNSREYQPDDGWMPVDAGAVVGGGLNLGIGDTEISFDLRYSMGFVPVVMNDNDLVGNRSFAVTMGLSL